MKIRWRWLRSAGITLLILCICFAASLLMESPLGIPEQITTSFAFAVFLISLLTEGYAWGLTAALISVLLVNYAFTFPYFAFNFLIPSNFFSAVVMTVISILTSALTTKVKRQEAVKAEGEKERMRANLLRAISHDLRTPLTTIYGSCTALREGGDGLTEEQRDGMLQGIQEDSLWLVRMVENLLSITRFDGGRFHLSTVPTAADELIDAVIVKVHSRYPGQKVIPELPEEPVIVSVDALLIQQVLINLVENAIQHADGMTRLILRVRLSGEQAVFEVEDNGCGASPERLRRMFDGSGGQEEPPADHARGSTGIGLSVCGTIVRAHGGALEADALPEGGLVFRFALKTEDTSDE